MAKIEQPSFKEGDYKYNLSSTGYSSTRYGPCEVCRGHTPEVFHQSEQQAYIDHKNVLSWTFYKCNSYFGHYDCLIKMQR